MTRLMITLDEESANLLDGKKNKAHIVREAIKLYNGSITTDTLDGIRAAFLQIRQEQEKQHEELTNMLFEMNEKLDTIVRRATGEYQ